MNYFFSLQRFLLLVSIFFLLACNKEPKDLGLRSPYAVYITMTPNPLDAATVPANASGSQSIENISFRGYVNMLYDKPVTVRFSLTGTAVIGTHYLYQGDSTFTIPASQRYIDFPLKVVRNSLGTGPNRTIIFTLVEASEGFGIGIGSGMNYTRSTYTITKP